MSSDHLTSRSSTVEAGRSHRQRGDRSHRWFHPVRPGIRRSREAHTTGDPPAVAPSRTRYARTVKPVLDRVVAALLLVHATPLLLLVAVLVRVILGPGVLFRQIRVGKEGIPFEVLKFRTMQPDRRERAEGGYHGPQRRRTHKSSSDPRHTRLGRFLRRTSLDELPQLWNVVRGDMSLVGPRPELPEVVDTYEPWQHQRHLVRPGVTGLWQVTERDHDGAMKYHVTRDLEYIQRMSPWFDLGLLVLTLPAIVGVTFPGLLEPPGTPDDDRATEAAPAREEIGAVVSEQV